MSMTKPRPTLDAQPALKPCGCPHLPPISRRNFLKATGLAGLVAGIAGEDMFTRMAFGATPYTGDVLVVLSLRGGFDGLSAIVPASAATTTTTRRCGRTSRSRPGQLIQLDATFGMHPAMAPLKPFWDAQTFGVVHAVGMAEPNRSHFEAMEEMERAAPGSSLRTAGSTACWACASRARLPGDADGIEHGRLRVPRAEPRARDVRHRLLQPGRRVGRHGAGAVGHGPARVERRRAGVAERAVDHGAGRDRDRRRPAGQRLHPGARRRLPGDRARRGAVRTSRS